MPVAIEQHVEWIADCIAYMREHGLTTVEAVPAAQDNWVAHVNEVVNGTLLPLGNSWWMSANIPGKPRAFLPYLGPEGIGGYRKRRAEIAAKATRVSLSPGRFIPGPAVSCADQIISCCQWLKRVIATRGCASAGIALAYSRRIPPLDRLMLADYDASIRTAETRK